ncbi:MAG: LysE family translocator [Hyphomicrobiales bacterium]|nr:LysE family translocator [Hyphomicrobiales bacterium]
MSGDVVDWSAFLAVLGVWSATVLSPGPNFLATVHAALHRSRSAGLAVALGIAIGTLVWATASLAGLALLFQNAAWLYAAVKFCGACYLIYVGVRMIVSAQSPSATARVGCPSISGWWAVRHGILTDLANPKAAAFFASLFAVAVPPAAPLWFHALIIASVVVIAGAWYAACACLIVAPPIAHAYRRAQRAVTAATGALFVGIGARLAAER